MIKICMLRWAFFSFSSSSTLPSLTTFTRYNFFSPTFERKRESWKCGCVCSVISASTTAAHCIFPCFLFLMCVPCNTEQLSSPSLPLLCTLVADYDDASVTQLATWWMLLSPSPFVFVQLFFYISPPPSCLEVKSHASWHLLASFSRKFDCNCITHRVSGEKRYSHSLSALKYLTQIIVIRK